MTQALRCPRCDTVMNRHAEKVVHADNPDDLALVDPALGGVLEQTHACPGCGNVEATRVVNR